MFESDDELEDISQEDRVSDSDNVEQQEIPDSEFIEDECVDDWDNIELQNMLADIPPDSYAFPLIIKKFLSCSKTISPRS